MRGYFASVWMSSTERFLPMAWWGLLALHGACHGRVDISVIPRLSTDGSASVAQEDIGGSSWTAGGDLDSTSSVEAADTDTETAPSSSETMACALGTPLDCGFCGDGCPGPEDASTSPVCDAGRCTLYCKGESYDVNGDPYDGCEAEDLPLQDAPERAVVVHLPDVDDPELASNPLDLSAAVYGDTRAHEPPEARPLGREDWFVMTTEGIGRSNHETMACLGIVNFPPDNRFEVCMSDSGVTTFEDGGCRVAVGGGDSACAQPPEGGDLGGPYRIRIRKLEGTPTLLRYSLFLAH